MHFTLRQGVKWHDGKPFTAADVRCTFDLLMEKGEARLRRNPRGVWYENVEQVTVDLPSGAVTVESAVPLVLDEVRAAVDEAGYDLAEPPEVAS